MKSPFQAAGCRVLIFLALSPGMTWAAAPQSRGTAPVPIRKLSGRHLTLYTDVAPNASVDVLPEVFDRAVAQWCKRFQVQATRAADWQVTGYLMQSKEQFVAAGHLPKEMPDFPNGYSTDLRIWLHDQSSPYYRRHLLLHEGTHCFMFAFLGAYGPPWYAEGMSELMATHRWHDQQLTLAHFPTSKQDVYRWGRIELVHQSRAKDGLLTLDRIAAYDQRARRDNRAYAWSWAAAAFLDGHPNYQARFRELPKILKRRDFTNRALNSFKRDRRDLDEDWQVYIADLGYGYDFPRMVIERQKSTQLPDGGAEATLRADHGWQSSGFRLEAGKSYRLRASGRYQIAKVERIWWCEPGGVTIRYYQGRPLGVLLGAVRPEQLKPGQSTPLIDPITLGLEATITPAQSGTLYLRVNDAASLLADNAGTLNVTIEASPGEATSVTAP